MDKKKILEYLYAMRECAIWNIFSQQCFHEYIKILKRDSAEPFKLPGVCLIDGTNLGFGSFFDNLELENKSIKIKRLANSFVTRNWLSDAFRLLIGNPRLKKRMEKESWYQFARIHVNVSLHGGAFCFNNSDKKHLPVSYKEVTVTENHNGQQYSLPLQYAYELVEAITQLVEKEVNSDSKGSS